MSPISLTFNLRKRGGPALTITALLLIVLLLPFVPLGSVEGNGEEPTRSLGTEPMGEWGLLTSGGWPSIDSGDCNIMYREAENELVVFHRTYSDFEVWSLFESNETWKQWNDTGMEPSPQHSSQAFTSNKNNTIAYYYGGYQGGGGGIFWDKLNIFFYSNKTWIQIDAPGTLGGRYWSEMVYDEATDSVWIFGGRDRTYTRYNDLHQYNFTHGWSYYPSVDPKPDPRDQALMTITPDGKHIYVGFGRYASGGGGANYYRHDIWQYNVTDDEWWAISNDTGIPTDAGAILQYRPVTSDLILTLGFDGWNQLNDTYIIDITTGIPVQVNLTGGIPGRHVQAFDITSDHKKAMIFGDDGDRRDIWSLDLLDYTTMLTPGNPTWVGGNAFTGYDEEDGGKLVALKRDDGDNWQLAYYSLDTRSWRMNDVSDTNKPTYHSGMASCYDPIENDFYLYGGYFAYQVSQWTWHYYFYDEFWKLDCDTGDWTRIQEHATPGARGRASMVIDPDERMIYLYGGQVHGGDTETLYRYNMTGNIWKAINPSIKPQARMETDLAFDPVNNGFYMFGGQRNGTSNAELNDFWFFHINTGLWEKLPTGDDEPSMQDNARLSVNTDTNEVMLFGDGDDDTFFWRLEWFGWKRIATM
ncbi:MAG: kelch repeat-containing protein, partial [Thermoplasmatota archaeon]